MLIADAAAASVVGSRLLVLAASIFSNRNLSLKASRRGIFLVVVEVAAVDASPY